MPEPGSARAPSVRALPPSRALLPALMMESAQAWSLLPGRPERLRRQPTTQAPILRYQSASFVLLDFRDERWLGAHLQSIDGNRFQGATASFCRPVVVTRIGQSENAVNCRWCVCFPALQLQKTIQMRSSAIRRARSSSVRLGPEREPTKFVSSDFRMLTRLSHMIQLGCLRPSSGPIATCVDRSSPLLKTGAQITVEKRESIRACRLTTTNIRYNFGSCPGLKTRYSWPRPHTM